MHGDWEKFEHAGRTYARRIEHDAPHGAPWGEEDVHGPVSAWTTRAKLPGEMVLASDGNSRRFYNFAEAVRIARRDGWDTEPFGTGTKGTRAHRAALADFKRLQDWCEDRWHYIGVIVAPVCRCCGGVEEGESVSLWGIESDAGGYLNDVAIELAEELHKAE